MRTKIIEIFVPEDTMVEKTLQLNEEMQLQIHVRSGAKLSLVFESNAVSQSYHVSSNIHVQQGASLDLCDLDINGADITRTHDLHIRQEANSQVFVQNISLATDNNCNTTQVDLCGEGAELSLNGLVIADKEQNVDNHTLVKHIVPHTTSHQLFKYVLNDKAVGTYAGLVKVFPGAHHTLSEQTNRNLCTTREARMFAQPQLEIYNDDVRCNHGSSTGQLDESALFYMQQRGISLHEARLLLTTAFVGEVVEQVRIPALRDRLQDLVEQRLRISNR